MCSKLAKSAIHLCFKVPARMAALHGFVRPQKHKAGITPRPCARMFKTNKNTQLMQNQYNVSVEGFL
jgi:hypothetical protein